KNEGELFVLAAFVAAALAARRPQVRPLVYAALVVLAIDLPWRLWVQLRHVKNAAYSLSSLFSPRYLSEHTFRLSPSVHELLFQMRRIEAWSYVDLLILGGV